MTTTNAIAIGVIAAAIGAIVYFGLSFGKRHRQHQARMLHPSRRTQTSSAPFPHSGWFAVAAVVLICVLVLILVAS